MRGRGRGSGQARGGGGVSRGRKHAVASTQAWDLHDDADYIPAQSSRKVIIDEDDVLENSDASSSSQFAFIPATWS